MRRKDLSNSWLFGRTDGDMTVSGDYRKYPEQQREAAIKRKQIDDMREQKELEKELGEVWE